MGKRRNARTSQRFVHDVGDPNEPLMPYTDVEGFTRMVPRCQAHVLLYPECREPGGHFYTNADPTDPTLVIRLCARHWDHIVSLMQLFADIEAAHWS